MGFHFGFGIGSYHHTGYGYGVDPYYPYYTSPAYVYPAPVVYPQTVVVEQQPVIVEQPITYAEPQAAAPVVIQPDQQPQVIYEEQAPAQQGSEQTGVEIIDAPDQTAPPTTEQAPVDDVNRLMMEGTEQFVNGAYEESARSFLKVMMQDENNVDSILAYAVARFSTGDYIASAIAIRRGVKLYPDVVNADFDVRDRYGNIQDFDEHYGALESFVLGQPKNVDGWVVIGFIQHFTGVRDLSKQTWELVKERSLAHEKLADLFLNAKPLEEIRRAEPPADDGTETSPAPAEPPAGASEE